MGQCQNKGWGLLAVEILAKIWCDVGSIVYFTLCYFNK